MNQYFNIQDPRRIISIEKEGLIREALAVFFLSAPPLHLQTSEQRLKYKRAIRRLADLEILSLLQSSTIKRPLRYGDVNALLISTLEASLRLMNKKGVSMKYYAPEKSFCMAAEPRLITVALVTLLNSYALANPNGSIYCRIRINNTHISVSISGSFPLDDPCVSNAEKALELAQAAAKLHNGAAVVSANTTAFSLGCGFTERVGLFSAPTVHELLNNPLSIVNIGLA
ncbi:MAG TPA: hypothetical protein DEB10_04760 [Ruminococcaceae bacterium]|jgi:hypothetical protein|nr:hypothetical protein [Oscillospiraceae bacterium]HCA29282.1 hypothetical protein [Oscillospiraceae bacterium]